MARVGAMCLQRATFRWLGLEKGRPAYRLFWLCGGLHSHMSGPSDALAEGLPHTQHHSSVPTLKQLRSLEGAGY